MIRLIFSISFIVMGVMTYGQHDGNTLYDHDLDEDKWQDIRDGIRYEGVENGPGREWTYESQKEFNDAKRNGNGNGGGSGGGNGSGHGSGSGSGSSKQFKSPPKMSPPPKMSSPSGGLGGLGYVLLAVFIVALIFLIYYLFINRPKDGKKVGTAIHLDEINPIEIPLTELQKLLQEAIDKGDYRGAVRIYFIFIIRDLSEKKWIQWEKEKTNFHYLREMSGKNEFDDFNRSVSFFEIIWYGKREIDEQIFNQVKPNFTGFLDKLGVR